jgi:hypothetical protein
VLDAISSGVKDADIWMMMHRASSERARPRGMVLLSKGAWHMHVFRGHAMDTRSPTIPWGCLGMTYGQLLMTGIIILTVSFYVVHLIHKMGGGQT